MEALISVIIPVYKVEKYLERCVESVRAQTYQNMEIILVDDGSPDECPKMCDEYAKKDSRIRVIHQKNRGLSGARNTGIDHARGEYLAFLDSDDIWSVHFLESLYGALKENNAELAQCRWEYMHGDVLLEDYDPEAKKECFSGRRMLSNLYIQTGAYYVVAWNKLYKRELFEGCTKAEEKIRYPEGRINEDEATTYKLFDRAEKCVMIDNALYGYFVGGTSITRSSFSLKKLDFRLAQKERIAYFMEKNYKELVVPAVKAMNDGSIDLYFKCRELGAEAKEPMKEIRSDVMNSLKIVKKYGKLPLKTCIGYCLFAMVPGLYGKLIGHVADYSQIEKYS